MFLFPKLLSSHRYHLILAGVSDCLNMAATAATTAAAAGSSDASALLARLHPDLYLSNHLAHSSRASSSTSSPLTFPQVDLNIGPISSASSSANRPASIPSPSALVKYGSTTVICNITPSIVYPSAAESSSSSSSSSRASSSSSSTIIPSISLTPLSSPSNDFKSGAPSNYAQATTERLFSFLDAAMPFDPSVLHIPTDLVASDPAAEGEAAQGGSSSSSSSRVRAKWTLFADCVVIGFDGALLETCMLAIIAALRQGESSREGVNHRLMSRCGSAGETKADADLFFLFMPCHDSSSAESLLLDGRERSRRLACCSRLLVPQEQDDLPSPRLQHGHLQRVSRSCTAQRCASPTSGVLSLTSFPRFA